jgi:hypothetical protein
MSGKFLITMLLACSFLGLCTAFYLGLHTAHERAPALVNRKETGYSLHVLCSCEQVETFKEMYD